ncbi:tetratricopeptide repeat protein [Deinococcus deserti]|uniref:Putative Tetratricopeptide repeat (TPR)-containing transcriptional regulator n=1 Tax=Deinococcus deserti (strain DSM 17065 / CIP 109153 / LMG 22923 / VCD115) TaxID=546414 RepID=C1CW78_DEIDV|nr:tetratricopeptide repeat protein [Deinococcus deserti]ACO46445.1 putative Tetratricopeptide repeat (TPR)-containing transcriptional regulator [Deinococcus deserti VCD115]
MSLNWRDLTSSRRARWPIVQGAVARPRLRALLTQARVLLVVAPAGFGKTTALAAGAPGLGGPGAWLTLDADDADPQVLAGGLALAVEDLPGGAGAAALLDAGASPRRVAARVADVLDACGALLVLDEAQHLTGSLASDVLRELVSGGAGRVALLSRVPLTLPDLTRLETQGDVQHLSATDLAFTADEVGELLCTLNVPATGADVRLAHAVTEGWPIAVRFLAQAAAQGRVHLRQLADLDGGEAQLGTLFTYLAQEVIGPLDPELRVLLTRSSVFEELTPELLEAVLNQPQARELLDALAGSGIFLTRVGDEGYRAHPLLRAHLRAGLPAAEVRTLSARGAAYFEATGRPRRAMAAHLLSGNAQRAAQLLSAYGRVWLRIGRVTLIERSLGRLPKEAWTPDLHALAGDALRLSSRYGEALAAYAQAAPLERALGEVQVALDTVQPDLAWEALDIAEQLAPAEQRDTVRRLRAENLLNAGQLAEAVKLSPSLAGGVRYALRSGDLSRALTLALEAARGEAGGARAAQNHREGLLLASFLHALLGEPDLAIRRAREGLAEGARLESPFVQALALARLGHALVAAGQTEQARQAYEDARVLARGVAGRLQVEPLMGLSYLAGLSGDVGRAASLRAEAVMPTAGDSYMQALLHLTSALGTLHAELSSAVDLTEARAAFMTCGDRFGLAAVALAAFAAGQGDAAPAAAAAAQFPFLLARRTLLSPYPDRARRAALLARLVAAVPDTAGALRAAARDLGYPDVPSPTDAPGFEVHVQVLDRLAVTRGDDPRPRDWGRAKARDLLALLAVHEDGLARDTAQETLFPEADPGVGERNFRVTLHALGQVLEEGAPSGAFLERGEWLRLRRGPDLHIDLHSARALLAQATGTPGRLDALLRLPAQVADTELAVVQQEAERYAARLPEALSAEAICALELGHPDRAAKAAERALSLDPAHEPAARVLMRVCHLRGGASALRRVYANLRASLCEMGLEPLPDTSALYRALGGTL